MRVKNLLNAVIPMALAVAVVTGCGVQQSHHPQRLKTTKRLPHQVPLLRAVLHQVPQLRLHFL